MNVVVCKNGHYYDADTYGVCPHCGAESAIADAGEAAPEKQKKSSFWKRGKTEEKHQPIPVPAAEVTPPQIEVPQPAGYEGDSATVALPMNNIPKPLSTDDVTVPIWGNSESNISANAAPQAPVIPQETAAPQAPVIPQETVVLQTPVVSPEPAEQSEEASELRDAIKKASANPEGKTVGFFRMAAQGDGGAKESASAAYTEPPTGWLVCVKGAHFGECFAIISGRNTVGRYNTNNIALERDNSVSREKHAWVTYEPRKREFYVKPGDGNALTYLNDEMIEESHRLQKMDKIELGDTALLFFPLCGEEFSWEEYMKKED